MALDYFGASSVTDMATIIVTLSALLPVAQFAPGYHSYCLDFYSHLQIGVPCAARKTRRCGLQGWHRMPTGDSIPRCGDVWHVRRTAAPSLHSGADALRVVLPRVAAGRSPQLDAGGLPRDLCSRSVCLPCCMWRHALHAVVFQSCRERFLRAAAVSHTGAHARRPCHVPRNFYAQWVFLWTCAVETI